MHLHLYICTLICIHEITVCLLIFLASDRMLDSFFLFYAALNIFNQFCREFTTLLQETSSLNAFILFFIRVLTLECYVFQLSTNILLLLFKRLAYLQRPGMINQQWKRANAVATETIVPCHCTARANNAHPKKPLRTIEYLQPHSKNA